MQYSPSVIMGAATYDFAAGLCIPEPTPEYCGHHVLNQVPHDKVCDDVDAIEAIQGPITIEQLAPMSEGARGRNGTELSPLQEDPHTPSLTSRNLATGKYPPGSFRIIRNPSGRSSTGALGTHAILIPRTDQVRPCICVCFTKLLHLRGHWHLHALPRNSSYHTAEGNCTCVC